MLDAVLQAVQAVAVILALILTGYFLSKRKVFTENTDKLLTGVLSYTLIPALAFSNVTEYITRDLLQNAGTDLLIPFAALVITFVLGQIIARLLKLPRSRRGVFCVAFGFSNSILVGLPITTSLFGTAGIPYTMYYYLSNTILFWLVGVYYIQKDAGCAKLFSFATLKMIFIPPLVMMLLGLVFVILDIKPPMFISQTAKYMGGAATPLALFLCGLIMYRSGGLRAFRFDRGVTAVVLGRFAIAPAIIYGMCAAFSTGGMIADVYLIQMSMPVMSNSYVMAERYGADSEFATRCFVITTILSLAATPILRLIQTLAA